MPADALVLDLDNTLYRVPPGQNDGWKDRVVAAYRRRFGLTESQAERLSRHHFETYGLTLTGLIQEGYDVDPSEYLEEVFPRSLVDHLGADPELDAALSGADRPMYLCTNSHMLHAEHVLDRLGVRRHFLDIIDITRMDFRAKPDARAFRTMLSRVGLPPDRIAFADDCTMNVVAAKQLGIRTIHVGTAELTCNADVAIETIYELRRALDALRRMEATRSTSA